MAERKNRRASRPAPEGVDPRPSEQPITEKAGEDRPEAWGDVPAARARSASEEQLLRDRPPHWG
ncbi:hypothetical protein ICL81_04425 [Leucobacter sp. cx-328]|uniref:hypothetical protein n=1 Tax=unclassified Leucobacter TaxID=2621730 RepID=UPI00165E4F22|nr:MULTISPECIES: hypothetical protein [unclassified Leucobacter]MBC9943772.1 hypothetical protein [Leucobacter sp. cx-328]